MLTKVNFKGTDFQSQFKNDEIKNLLQKIEIKGLSKNYYVVNKNGKIYELTIENDETGNLIIYYKGKIFISEITKTMSEGIVNTNVSSKKESIIKSPMPGLIAKIKVNPGDAVKKGDGLLTIEAMKMENEIKAPISGIVESIKVSVGTVVEKNAVLVVLQSQK